VNQRRKFERRAEQEKLWNLHQAQRNEAMARGERSGALLRLPGEEVPEGDDALIALPPLRIVNTP
jgi:hypothetical protein